MLVTDLRLVGHILMSPGYLNAWCAIVRVYQATKCVQATHGCWSVDGYLRE